MAKLSRSRSFWIASTHMESATNHSAARTVSREPNAAQLSASAIRAHMAKIATTGV